MATDALVEDEVSEDGFIPPGMTAEEFDAYIAEGDADIAAGRSISGKALEEFLADFVAGRPLQIPD